MKRRQRVQTIDQWLEEKTTELAKTFPEAKFVFVVLDEKNIRTMVANITEESLKGLFLDMSEDAGDNATSMPVGKSH
jgi:hypothetical protein